MGGVAEWQAGTSIRGVCMLLCAGRIRGVKFLGEVRDLEGRSGSLNIIAAAEGYWSRVFIISFCRLLFSWSTLASLSSE